MDRVLNRRDDAAAWAILNPILEAGEIGIETGYPDRIKYGDGITAWNSLPYYEDRSQPTKITYANLLALKGSFKPEHEYEIIDFATTKVYDEITDAGTSVNFTGAPERIVVKAATRDALEPIARSLDYPSDILWYELVGSLKTSIGGIIMPAFTKGCITRRIDTVNDIDITCDFRTYKSRLWDDGTGKYWCFSSTGNDSKMFPVFAEGALVKGVHIGMTSQPIPIVFRDTAEKVVVGARGDGIVCLDAAGDVLIGTCSKLIALKSIQAFTGATNSRYLFRGIVNGCDAGSNIYADGPTGITGDITSCQIMTGYDDSKEIGETSRTNEMIGFPVEAGSVPEIVEATNLTQENAAYAAGAMIVIRTDLI